MKITDQKMSAALAAAVSELSNRDVVDLYIEGGKVDLDFGIGRAKLWPGQRTKVHPYPSIEFDPDPSNYPIHSISMWLLPLPASEQLRRKPLTRDEWDELSELTRDIYVASIDLWIKLLREVENGALRSLNSRAPHTGTA